jgi:hypothetical protein
MMDRAKYTYNEISGGLVLRETAIGTQPPTPEDEVCPILDPLLQRCKLRHPTWLFVAKDGCGRMSVYENGNLLGYYRSSVSVYDEGQCIGLIGSERYNGPRFIITNPRLNNEKLRGNGYKTKDITKALKSIDKYFYRNTKDEELRDAAQVIRNHLHIINHKHNREYSNLIKVVTEVLASSIENNFTATEPLLQKLGVKPSIISALPVLKQQTPQYKDMCGMKAGWTVLVEDGNRYSMLSHLTEEIKTVSIHDLPDSYKLRITQLKLLAPGELLLGVGYKQYENTLYLTEIDDEPQ